MNVTLESLVGFFGVVVPDWRTRTEVEEGDEMGMVVQSAGALGLAIEYQVWQDEPGYEDGEVVSITPPPGTLVQKGSTVIVVINLQH